MTMFYIHWEDPGFVDPPWPGQRRLGPFLTKREALEQAASDMSLGMGTPLGVWSEAESEKARLDEGMPETKAAYTHKDIGARADELTAAREKGKTDDKDALAGGLLAAGLPAALLDDVMKMVKS